MLSKWVLTEEERTKYINALKGELAVLRAKAGISQADLANLIGVSRQTYSSIESGRKPMMWSTYLSLILFFDYNLDTREMVRSLPAYPEDIIRRINTGRSPDGVLFEQSELNSILKELDEQALHSLRTMILVEYARCKKLSGETVVKSFEGFEFLPSEPDRATELAIRNIQNRRV